MDLQLSSGIVVLAFIIFLSGLSPVNSIHQGKPLRCWKGSKGSPKKQKWACGTDRTHACIKWPHSKRKDGWVYGCVPSFRCSNMKLSPARPCGSNYAEAAYGKRDVEEAKHRHLDREFCCCWKSYCNHESVGELIESAVKSWYSRSGGDKESGPSSSSDSVQLLKNKCILIVFQVALFPFILL